MSNMIAYLFPGQGAQHKGMGAALFPRYPELTQKANEILGYSIEELCLEDRAGQLGKTEYTQPALFVVNALSYLQERESGSLPPAFAAGHSLGEYSALFAAGAVDFETGLRLVKKRGELMGAAREGGMAAVIGLDAEGVRKVLADAGLSSIDIANINSSSQTVVSGPRDAIVAAEAAFKGKCRLYLVLNVSGAFHSRLMKPAQAEFASFVRGIGFSPLRFPVMANVCAQPYGAADLPRLLVEQIAGPVRWLECVASLRSAGVTEFRELGPGKTLTKLLSDDRAKRAMRAPAVRKEVTVAVNPAAVPRRPAIGAEALGSQAYRQAYGVRYACAAGGMHRGISSRRLVAAMARGGMMSYFGAAGLDLSELGKAIEGLRQELSDKLPWGVSLWSGPSDDAVVNLLLEHDVRNLEAAGFLEPSPALVRYRLKGARQRPDGGVEIPRRLMLKTSRPEIAEQFLAPAPAQMVERLLREGAINAEEARAASGIPLASDICAMADSGGPTDHRVASTLIPAIVRLRDQSAERWRDRARVRVGAAGGIGTAESAAAAFVLGADFIVTGSINQCTVEADTSDAVKDLLQGIDVQDTAYAPATDLFELGAKVQVVKKGVFFPSRANRLRDIYHSHNSLDELDAKTRELLETRYFKRPLDEVFIEAKKQCSAEETERADRSPKARMALVFRWYLSRATDLALHGEESERIDFQIYCGPALGAFNQWMRGSDAESWRNRHVDQINERLMQAAADVLSARIRALADA
jgi:trans-AT polyketide synthase/acyltransferase/oxidoreductase domain-containing protein